MQRISFAKSTKISKKLKKIEKKLLTYVMGGAIIIKSPRYDSDTKASQTQINTELESDEL